MLEGSEKLGKRETSKEHPAKYISKCKCTYIIIYIIELERMGHRTKK